VPVDGALDRKTEDGFAELRRREQAATRSDELTEAESRAGRGDDEAGASGRGARVRWEAERLVRPIRWEVRLIDDAIVPTVPRPVGEVDDAARLRAQVWEERRARRPAALGAATVRQGVRWAAEAGERSGVWVGRAGPGEITLTADGLQAEAAWRDGPRPGEGWTAELGERRAGGSVGADGTLWWRATAGVRAWRWVEVRLAGAVQPQRWQWQQAGGAELPDGWRATVEADGRARIAWPIGEAAGPMALVERSSGWALVVTAVDAPGAAR